MQNLVDSLMQRQLLWKANEQVHHIETVSSEYKVLDQKLSGGFPKTGVIDIHSLIGIGELRLLIPFLSKLPRLIVFINPPGYLCAEFFHHQGFDLNSILFITTKRKNESLWAAEQCLKSGASSAVFLWMNRLDIHHAKRLQIASSEGEALQFLLRHELNRTPHLPVSLSLGLNPYHHGIEVSISKRRGGWPIPAFKIDMQKNWPQLTAPKHSTVIPFPYSLSTQAK